MGMLFVKCPICKGGTVEPEKRLSNGHCPGCDNKLHVPVGMTARQLDDLCNALKALIGGRLRATEPSRGEKDLGLRAEQTFSAYAGRCPMPLTLPDLIASLRRQADIAATTDRAVVLAEAADRLEALAADTERLARQRTILFRLAVGHRLGRGIMGDTRESVEAETREVAVMTEDDTDA